MIVLDTTVLVYAVGSGHELREPCRRLIGAIARGEIEAGTTVEVIQEFAHVRARRRGHADAAAVAVDYVDLLSPLIEVSAAALRTGLKLFAESERLGAFDAVLAGAASSSAVTALVSADRAFSEVVGLRYVYPDAAGVAALVGSAE